MKREKISIYISILALIVSSISLLLSYQNREHDRLVAYEQRKQELRQLMLEGELLFEKLEKAIMEHVRIDETPERREDAAKIWMKVKNQRREMESTSAEFNSLPATSGTKARLGLERMFAGMQQINKGLRKTLELANERHGASHKEANSPDDRVN